MHLSFFICTVHTNIIRIPFNAEGYLIMEANALLPVVHPLAVVPGQR